MILAIDPGGTTGVAIRFQTGLITTCALRDSDAIWEMVSSMKAALDPIVVCEQFNPWHAHIDEYGLHTVRLIGGITALCNFLRIPIVEQPPQFRMKCVAQARTFLLARSEPFMVHEVDALAHLFAWELANGTKLVSDANAGR